MKKNKPIILVLIVAVAITGCATPASVTNMIPFLNYKTSVSTDKTLMVAEVKGGEKTNPIVVSKIENEGFQEALTNTLKGSGIFKEVFTDEKGDYKIYAEIISQELKSGFPTTSILFVNYRLIETTSGKEVWKENILSQYDAKFEEAFLGNVRAKKANEAAVRDNLTRLIKKLSNVLSKLN